MNNMYKQQLSEALIKTKNASEQNELTENNTVQGGKLGLYHAHGLTLKSSDQLKEDLTKVEDAAVQNRVAALGVTAAQNITTASNAALVDASNTTSTASAAAASIQKAATSITHLSGLVAATRAVANSLENGGQIQQLVIKADEATKEAAKLAEEAGIIALKLTIDASQSRAAGVVTQAGVVKSNVTSLAKLLTDAFSKQQDLINSDLSTVSSSVAAENEQAGVYKTALAEDNALKSSLEFLNQCVNNDLTCVIKGLEDGKIGVGGSAGDQFTLSFNPFREVEDNATIIDEYRIILVKEDDSVAFNIEAAKSTPKENYVVIKPDPKKATTGYSQDFITADFLNANDVKDKGKARFASDYSGTPVTKGVPYTFFVYVVYTNDYQRNSKNTNGLLSLAAPGFTLRRYLPEVLTTDMSLLFYSVDKKDAVRVAFKVPAKKMMINSETNLNELMEFRTFLFNDLDRKAFQRNVQIDIEEDKLFSAEQNLRDKEEQCQVAQLAYDSALIQEPQDLHDLEKKKKKLALAKAQLTIAKTAYADQKQIFQNWLEGRISDFYIDEEIMETIPAANYMIAKMIPDSLMDKLGKSQGLLTEEVEVLNTQIVEYDTELKALKTKRDRISKELNTETTQDASTKEEIAMILQEIASLVKKLEAIRSEKVQLETEDDARRLQGLVPKEQEEQASLLIRIIESFGQLKKMKSDETTTLGDMEARNAELKEVNTNIILKNTQRGIINDQLIDLNVELKTVSDHLNQLTTLKKDDKAGDYFYYEAMNEAGDFTDNYGECTVNAQSYCVLIMSAIQDSQPEAAPLYQGRMSGFSTPVPFTLQ